MLSSTTATIMRRAAFRAAARTESRAFFSVIASEVRSASSAASVSAAVPKTPVFVDDTHQATAASRKSSLSPPLPQLKQAPAITKAEVQALFQRWNDALATLDPETVAQRYTKNAVLLPTLSNTPRTSPETIQNYFVTFLQQQPQGRILQSHVMQTNDMAVDAGTYEFTMGRTGNKVQARYSFVYVYEDGEWKIAHHHSSVMPEQALMG